MAQPGLKQIMLCEKGMLRNNPQHCIAMGAGDEASFERTSVPIKGNNDEEFEGRYNHKISYKSFQFSPTILAILLYFCKEGGADVHAVGQKLGTNLYTGIYDYSGDNCLGVDFVYTQGSKDRNILLTAEAEFEAAVDLQIMQSSNSLLPIDLNALGLGKMGVDISKFVAPSVSTLYNPQGTAACNGVEIVDRLYTIKPITIAKEFNRKRVNFWNFNYALTIDRVNGYELVEYLVKDINASLRIDEKGPGNSQFAQIFDAGLFYRKTDLLNKKTEGNIKLTFNRNFSLGDIAIDINNRTLTVANEV